MLEMSISETDASALTERIDSLLRVLVDYHDLTKSLPEIERRNMAYCGSHAAVSALSAHLFEASETEDVGK